MQTTTSTIQDDGEIRYNARAITPNYPSIFEHWKDGSARARAQYTATNRCRLNIAYGDHPNETLDLFLPEGQAHATLIYIHAATGIRWISLTHRWLPRHLPNKATRSSP